MSAKNRLRKRIDGERRKIETAKREAFNAAADVLNSATQCRSCIAALRAYGDRYDAREEQS